jgi:hypothetical protein
MSTIKTQNEKKDTIKETGGARSLKGGAMDAARRRRAESQPLHYGLFMRVYAGKSTPCDCIRAMCLECITWDPAAIRECTAVSCPLWHRRPYQVKRGGGRKG